MPRYYCDYCDTYLTHDSPSVRKQHNAGYKHKANVRTYYQQYEQQLNQSLIDQKVKEHLGAFRPLGPPYPMRPGLPVLPTPQMPMTLPVPMPGSAPLPSSAQLMPGMRPLPMMPRPAPGVPGYSMPQMMTPQTAPLPGQSNGIPRPLTAPPPMVSGSAGMPASSGAPPMFTPMYQGMAVPASNGENSDMSAQAAEANH